MELPEVIIPAAGEGTRVQDVAFSKPKPLISLSGKPIISWITETLIGQGLKTINYVVPNRIKYDPLRVYINDIYEDMFSPKYHWQRRKLGPLHAIHIAAKSVKTKGVLIVLADTICFDILNKFGFDHSWVLAYPVKGFERWCLVDKDRKGFVSNLYDKVDTTPNTNLALIGVYYFHDLYKFNKITADVIRNNIRHKNEYQISSAIENYLKKYPVKVHVAESWHDVGTIDNLWKASNFMMKRKSRAFNKIHTDFKEGAIHKESNSALGRNILLNEINYYNEAPVEIKKFFPRIFSTSTENQQAKLTIEYWPFDILSDIFIYSRYSKYLWREVVGSITYLVDSLQQICPGENIYERTKRMLWDKTISRTNDLKEKNFPLLKQHKFIVNGTTVCGWEETLDKLRPRIDEIAEASTETAIHGDLCFSNILCDIKSGLIKCIDPRGKYGFGSGITGDLQYDIAKLRQSYHGSYDFLVNRLFFLQELNPDEFKFKIYSNKYHKEIGCIFDEMLFDQNKYNKTNIAIIEGLQFLSMCALHYEDVVRQKALWLQGLIILNDFVA